MLCDRCLDARLYRELKADEFVLLRKSSAGRLTLAHGPGGSSWTNLSALALDPEAETVKAVRELVGSG